MPFIFLLVGLAILVSGVRGTAADLGALLKGDLIGKHGFGVWVLALFVIGAVGYIPKMKGISDAFLLLVLLVIVLVNDRNGQGFFANLTSVINGTAPASLANTTSQPQSTASLLPQQTVGTPAIDQNASPSIAPLQPLQPLQLG